MNEVHWEDEHRLDSQCLNSDKIKTSVSGIEAFCGQHRRNVNLSQTALIKVILEVAGIFTLVANLEIFILKLHEVFGAI